MPSARSRYFENAVQLDGTAIKIVPNSNVTLYEAGTLTPISAASIFAGPTGSTTLGNPFTTDANGNVLFYLDLPRRVKIVAVGVGVGPLTADYEPVLPDPAEMLINHQTTAAGLDGGLAVVRDDPTSAALTARNSNTPGVASVGIAAGGTGYAASFAVSFSGGGGSGAAGTATAVGGVIQSVAITAPGSGYTAAPTPVFTAGGGSGASGVANLEASPAFQLFDPFGTSIVQAKRSPIGNNVFQISDTTTAVPDTSQIFSEKVVNKHFVNFDTVLIATGIGGPAVQDAGAFRGVAYQFNSGGNAMIRGVEAHAIRQSPANHTSNGATWCIECAMIADMPGNGLDQSAGLYVNSVSTTQRGDCGIVLTGGDLGSGGWEHYIRCMDNNRTTTLIDLTKTGEIIAGNVRPRTASTFSCGTISSPWGSVVSVSYSVATTGTEAGPQFNQFGFGTAGLFIFNNSTTGLTLGAADYATLTGTGLAIAKQVTASSAVIGAAVGGNRGAGTINVATGIYLNTAVYNNPDAALEHYFTGEIVESAGSPSAAGYDGRMALAEVRAYAREHHQLPRVAERDELFSRADILLEKVEEIFTHLWEVDDRLLALEQEDR